VIDEKFTETDLLSISGEKEGDFYLVLEQRIPNPCVAGSSPVRRTSFSSGREQFSFKHH